MPQTTERTRRGQRQRPDPPPKENRAEEAENTTATPALPTESSEPTLSESEKALRDLGLLGFADRQASNLDGGDDEFDPDNPPKDDDEDEDDEYSDLYDDDRRRIRKKGRRRKQKGVNEKSEDSFMRSPWANGHLLTNSWGNYEDFITEEWEAGVSSLEVAIFRGEPSSIKNHNDSRFDVLEHFHEEPPSCETLQAHLKNKYGGGVFRLRFHSETTGSKSQTVIKKTLVLSVEEDPIIKGKFVNEALRVEAMRLDAKRREELTKQEGKAQDMLFRVLESQRKELAEEVKHLRNHPQKDNQSEALMLKFVEMANEQRKQAEEDRRRLEEAVRAKENAWIELMRESEGKQAETQARLMETTVQSQREMFSALTNLQKAHEGENPMLTFLMQQQAQQAALQQQMILEERRREEERKREEKERLREEARWREEKERQREERERAFALQQAQMQQQQMQLMVSLLSAKGNDTKDLLSTLSTVAAPLLSKVLEPQKAQSNGNGSEMMQILLPLLSDSKKSAEERAKALEERLMSANDPKKAISDMMTTMQLLKSMQQIFSPPTLPPTTPKEEEEASDKAPSWMTALGDVAGKVGLDKAIQTLAQGWARGRAPNPTAQSAQPTANQPRAPRAQPLATPPPYMPPAALPPAQPQPPQQPQMMPMQPHPQAPPPQPHYAPPQPPHEAQQPQPQPQPHQPQPHQPPQQPPQTTQPKNLNQAIQEVQQAGQQPMHNPYQEILDSEPTVEVQDFLDQIEKFIDGEGKMSSADFVKSRSFVEKSVLKGLLPTPDVAVEYVRKWGKTPNIQSMRGLKWLRETVAILYR